MSTPSEQLVTAGAPCPQTFQLNFPERERPASVSDAERLEQVCVALERFAADAEAVRDAVEQGLDDARVRTLVDRSRASRARLQRAQRLGGELSPPATPIGMALVRRLRTAAGRARRAEPTLLRWLDGPPPSTREVARSTAAAARLVDRLLLPSWDLDADVVLLLGADTAPLARELRSRGQARVVVLLRDGEPDSGFPRRAYRTRTTDEVLTVLHGFHDPPPRHLVARQQGEWLRDDEADGGLLAELADGLEQVLAVRTTTRRFGRLWTEQAIANLPHVARWPSVAALDGALDGVPLVLIAPGPSLSRNIDQLAALKGRAVLCALSRALPALRDAGVVPDVVVVLDPLDLRYHFDGSPVEQFEALVLGLSVHPALYELPARRVFTFSGNSLVERWVASAFDEAMEVPTSCSVATSAFSMAMRWGCDPVVLVGQDLSFPGGKMYDAGAADGAAELRTQDDGSYRVDGFGEHARRLEASGQTVLSRGGRLREVPGYHGGTVPTSPSFGWVLSWFEEQAEARAGQRTLVNATEGGARVHGMEHLPLADVVARFGALERDVAGRLAGAAASVDPRERSRRLLGAVDAVKQGVERSGRLARQCARLASKFPRDAKRLRQLGRREEELIRAMRDASVFIALYGQREIDDALERARHAQTVEESLHASRALYDVVLEAHRAGYPPLAEAARAIHAAL